MSVADYMNPQAKRGGYIITSDPIKREIEVQCQNGEVMPISTYAFTPFMRWPAVGEQWVIREENGNWYLEAIWEREEGGPAQPGDAVISSATGKLWINEKGKLKSLGSTVINSVPSVKEFGAGGQGKTDDTAAIQACVNAQGNYGAAFLNPGEYQISGTISIPWENFTFMGAGYKSSTLRLAGGSNCAMISTPDDAVQRYGLMLRDIGLLGNSANQTGESPAVWIRGMSEAIIERLYIYHPRGAGIFIGQTTPGIFNTVPMISHCVMRADPENTSGFGIDLDSGSSDAQVTNNDIGLFKAGGGILASGHNGFSLALNQCWQNRVGYQLFAANRGRLVGNLADFSGRWGFVLQNLTDTHLLGNQSRESGQEGAHTYDGFFVEGTTAGNTCFNLMFDDCRAMGSNTRYAVRLDKNINTVEFGVNNFTGTSEGGISKGPTNVTNITKAQMETI